MLTYTLKKTPGHPLYEQLYQSIRDDIAAGRLPAGSRLPSKRVLAAHLGVSVVTVESAYAQLLAEGKPFPHPAGELVVTPHPGEMARLTGLSAAALAADRAGIALRYAKAWNAVVVLKGARTVVASPDGRVCVNPTGNPGLARGGSGDVLAGMLAALLACGLPAYQAAACAVYLHGAAADRAAEAAIVDCLQHAYPDHAILTEEAGRIGAAKSDYLWIVDPIDGTLNFMQGIPQYAVSIALAYRGEVVAGVIYDVAKNELFTAAKGEGAFLDNRRIRVSDRKDMNRAVIGTGFPFRRSDDFKGYMMSFMRVAERTAGEDVQQTQKSVAFQLAGIRRPLAQGVGVDARNHDETAQAEDQQQPDRVDHTFAQLLDLVDILERFNQFLVGRQKSDYH